MAPKIFLARFFRSTVIVSPFSFGIVRKKMGLWKVCSVKKLLDNPSASQA